MQDASSLWNSPLPPTFLPKENGHFTPYFAKKSPAAHPERPLSPPPLMRSAARQPACQTPRPPPPLAPPSPQSGVSPPRAKPETSHWAPQHPWTPLKWSSAAIGHRTPCGGRGRQASRTRFYMDKRGLHAVTWAMLLLYDHDCKAWCHDGTAMGQRYNDHFSSSYAPISMPRGLQKVG